MTDSVVPETLSLPERAVRALLLEHYGLRAHALQPLESELSTVFRVATAEGRAFACKASAYSERALRIVRWQVGAMERLQRLGIPAGETLPDRAGASVRVAEWDGRPVILHVGGWLEGIPLSEADPSPALMRAVGRTAAAVSAALAEWPAPPAPVSHPWELVRTLRSIDDSLARMPASGARALVEAARDRFLDMAGRLDALPRQTVHHDLHDSNLLVDGAESIGGVLDFGDMVRGPRIAELAVAAAYAGRAAESPVAAFLQVVEGWGRTVPLLPEEADALLDAAIGRLGVNLAVWTARGGGDRDAYARNRSARTARVLREFLDADPDAVRRRIRSLVR